jgi:prepilin-type N-terminal cleavage/methylation domain-containing protein
MNSMKQPFAARYWRLIGARSGFTLIELLAVMAIILILAGLILSIAGNANFRGAEARAQGEIQAISAACESYKTDNGAYPESSPAVTTGSDILSPLNDTDPAGSTSSAHYIAAGETLYQALAGVNASGGNTDANGNLLKVYMNFTPGQLYSTANSTNPDSTPPVATNVLMTTYVVDPFGLPYGYSTAQATANQTAAANSPPTTPATVGYNPTFDLWSTAGYSPTNGKSYPTNIAAANYYTLWIKNW